MSGLPLFDVPPVVDDLQRARCARGAHAALIDDPPVDHGACVNVVHRCAVCQQAVTETSWTTAAWEKQIAKARKHNLTEHHG